MEKEHIQLKVKIIQDEFSFKNLRLAWSNLLKQSSRPDIFLTWEWMFAWWRHYGRKNILRLITVWRGSELVGIAPLMITTRRKYGMTFRFICNFNSPHVDIGGFLFQPNDFSVLESIYSEITLLKSEWDLVELNGIPAECQEAALLKQSFQGGGYLIMEDVGQHFVISLTGTWDEYLKSLSHNRRKDINRSLRRIKEAGQIEYKCYLGQEIKWDHFQTMFKINEFGHFPALYRNPQERDFQEELFHLTINKDWMDIEFLYLDSVPIAYRYGFVFKNRFEAWRKGIDSRFDEYGPGKILLTLTLEEKFRRHINEFDFLLGDEPHKEHWRPKSSKFIRFRAVSPHHLHAALTYVWLPRLKLAWNKYRSPSKISPTVPVDA
jgi:CelD/BcsL family acetyltransferase involved in cellulose biosynthesis